MPAVHRDTDSRNCGAKTTVVGNGTVYVNGLLCSVKDDTNTHIKGELLADVNPGTIFAEGKLIVLLGSNSRPDLLHLNPKAAQGSPDVFGGGGGESGGGGGGGAGAGAGDVGGGSGSDEEAVEEDDTTGEETPEEETPSSPTDTPQEVQERIDSVNPQSLEERSSIEQAVAEANAETGLNWVPVRDQQTGEIFLTTNDFVRDSNGEYIRASGDIARSVADQFNSELPTRASQIDSIHSAANIRNPMVPAGVPGEVSYDTLVNNSNNILNGFGIEPGPGDLASGHFKVVGANGEIYHGTRPGSPNDVWQRSFTRQHSQSYVDYSQGVRLIRRIN